MCVKPEIHILLYVYNTRARACVCVFVYVYNNIVMCTGSDERRFQLSMTHGRAGGRVEDRPGARGGGGVTVAAALTDDAAPAATCVTRRHINHTRTTVRLRPANYKVRAMGPLRTCNIMCFVYAYIKLTSFCECCCAARTHTRYIVRTR